MKPLSIHDRISMCMSQLHLKNRHIVEATGASKGAVSQWINGKSEPSSKYIPSLARILRVSENWLLEGGPVNEIPPNVANTYHLKIHEIPLISFEQAAEWHELMHGPDVEAISWLEVLEFVSPYAFALKMENNSMMNISGQGLSIPVGATLIVDVGPQIKSGAIVVAKVTPNDKQAIVKQYVTDGPNKYLMSLNSNYERIQVTDETLIIGVCLKMQLSLY
ncbi:Cro/CI family transcriptional regulator [Acinetobacter baumannii]|nr:Cro/CI family transcriptional regulator [Acinetobacter baumannii]